MTGVGFTDLPARYLFQGVNFENLAEKFASKANRTKQQKEGMLDILLDNSQRLFTIFVSNHDR